MPPEAELGDDRVVSEFRYGTWRRSFYFGKRIDPNQLQAELRDGVLHITAAKVDSAFQGVLGRTAGAAR